MKRNKILYVLIFTLIMLINIPIVKADFALITGLTPGGEIEDYNDPEEVTIKAKQGDTISVYYYTNNWSETCKNQSDYCDFTLVNEIYTGIHYSEGLTFLTATKTNAISSWNLNSFALDSKVPGYNYIAATIGSKDDEILDGWNDLVKFDFKVDNETPDGVYTIAKTEDGALVVDNDDYITNVGGCYSDTITVIVGNGNGVDVEAATIPNNTYVIGTYMFTNEDTGVYNGQLTTRHIMRAAKTNGADLLSNMIIYYKNARGEWKDAINNSNVTPPTYFSIVYKDMVPYVAENSGNNGGNNSGNNGGNESGGNNNETPTINVFSGVYQGPNNTTLKLYNLDNNKVYVLIDNEETNVTGPGDIVNDVLTMDLFDIYTFTMTDNNVTLATENTEVPSGLYTRTSDYSTEEFYEDSFFADASYLSDPKYNSISQMSRQNGNEMETIVIYMFKTAEDRVNVVTLDNDGTLISSILYDIESDGNLYDRDIFDEDIIESKIVFDSDNTHFTFTEYDDEGNPYTGDGSVNGTYTVVAPITMNDIIAHCIPM